ncbi:MAG: PEP-CTERM sorting domain-containing protein [Pseudomonadales bacterium]
MFISARNMILGTILTLAATSASALPITFDFSGSGHRLLGYSQTFSQNGLGLTATAQGGGRLSQTYSGLGVGGSHHFDSLQLDGSIRDESILFRFSRSVRLLGFTLTRVGYYDEATLSVDDVPKLSFNIPGGKLFDNDTATVNTGLYGTDFQFGVTDWNDDYFINSLTVHATDVPEPGTIALFAVGLVGLGFARKRAKQ